MRGKTIMKNCPACSSPAQDQDRLCAACGWDFVAQKRVAKPGEAPAPAVAPAPAPAAAPQTGAGINKSPQTQAAGLELFFQPEPPKPKPAAPAEPPAPAVLHSSAPAAASPAAQAQRASGVPASAEEKPKEEAGPAWLPPALAESLRKTEAGRLALAVVLRKPRETAAAVAVFAILSGLWFYWMFRSSPATIAAAPSPTGGANAASAAEDFVRPAATFASTPRLVVNGPVSVPKPPPPVPAPAPAPAPQAAADPAAAKPAEAPSVPWTFQGVVFDLLSTRGVFAAKMVFVDSHGAIVGETETGAEGTYQITVPSGSGYTLKIVHGDYSGRYIDDADASNSLRTGSAQERRMLMQAASRNLPWVGNAKKPVYRDLALVPLADSR